MIFLYNINMRKSIIKNILITLGILVAIFIISIVIFVFCFTGQFAKTMYNLGNKGLALNYYVMDYNNHNSISSIKLACDISIELENMKKYEEAYQLFCKDNRYDDYIEAINTRNAQNTKLSLIVRSSLINENNYYKNMYMRSLIANNNNLAKGFVKENIAELNDTTVSYLQPCTYLLDTYLKYSDNYSIGAEKIDDTTNVMQVLKGYNTQLLAQYNEVSGILNIDNLRFLAYCRHFIIVLSNIKTLCSEINQDVFTAEDLQTIDNNITMLNDKIVEILGQ